MLNDFIVGNDLSIVDHIFHQNNQYTYFNISRNIHTWIDHVFSTQYDVCDIKSCDIIPLDVLNVSDHLPIRVNVCLRISDNVTTITPLTCSNQVFTNWSKTFKNVNYCAKLKELLNDLPCLSINSSEEFGSMQTRVDSYMDPLIVIFIDAAKRSNIVPKIIFKTKKYWCANLSRARDTKRFW